MHLIQGIFNLEHVLEKGRNKRAPPYLNKKVCIAIVEDGMVFEQHGQRSRR
jgi:hypothetical protein